MDYEHHEFEKVVARINDTILRVPDRLSNPKGEAIRAEYASIFAECILGHRNERGGLYLSLPFQLSLLTDPLLFIVAGGFLVLDHPEQSSQHDEFAFGDKAHIVALSPKASLFENRFPRLIACARKREKIEVSFMLNRLMQCEFKGPFK